MFKPGPGGKRSKSVFQISRYDWSKSDGSFGRIVGTNNVNNWVEKCNEGLENMEQCNRVSEESEEGGCGDGTVAPTIDSTSNENNNGGRTTKRVSAPVEQLMPTPKKKCKGDSQLHAKEAEFQRRTVECEVGRF